MYSSIFARHYLCQLQIAQYLFVFIFVNYELLNVCLSLSSSIMNCSTFLNNKSSTTEEDNHSVSNSIQHVLLLFWSDNGDCDEDEERIMRMIWWLQEGVGCSLNIIVLVWWWWWYRLFVTAAMTVDYDNDGPRMNIEWGNKSTMVIVPTKPYFFLPNLGWIGQKKKSLRSSSEPIMLFQKVER